MTNIFKSTSRFSALLDETKDFKKEKVKQTKNEIKPENKEEQFKYSEKKGSRFKPSDEKEIKSYKLEKGIEMKGQIEYKKEKERLDIDKDILSINNFPELISTVKKNICKEQDISYINALKKEEEIKDNISDPDLVNLQPGHVLIKKDRKTGNTITKRTLFYEEPKRSEKEIILDIVDTLIELHEKRTEEYIELNGYDVWEKMFKYPNWEEREAYLYEEDESSDEEDETGEDDEYYDEYDEYDEYYDY
jgi:hypothetical protein